MMKLGWPSLVPGWSILLLVLILQQCAPSLAFVQSSGRSMIAQHPSSLPTWCKANTPISKTCLKAQITEKEAQSAIDKVVAALRKDSQANEELGRLEKVTVVLGYGSPSRGSFAVRFNAQFKRGGFGLSAVPLPFGLGQTNKSEGRGTMVGQVKATVDAQTGKVSSCSVFRDLGYGRSFNLKV